MYKFNGQPKSEVTRDITDVAVDETVEKIGNGLFFHCEQLVTVNLLEGLRVIGAFAFGRCSSLQTVSIPSTVEVISEDAFCHCKSLTTIYLKEGLKSIGNRAFGSCTSLKHVSIPSTVEGIGREAFRICKSLESVEMKEGLKTIGSHSYYHCLALTEVSVPSTVFKIGAHAFAQCKSLVDIHLQEGLKTIGQMAFLKCTSLFAISLPKSLESTGFAVFLNCSTLMGVEFPLGIDVKMANTFSSCSALVNIFLPSSMSDKQGFCNSNSCSALEAVVDNQDIIETLSRRFDNRPMHKACYDAYQTKGEDILAITLSGSEEDIVDGLGMTPFHILATSARQRDDLLEALLEKYPVEVICRNDRNGKTMIEYLLVNRSPKAIPLIQRVLQKTLVDSMCSWSLNQWKISLLSMVMESGAWQGHAGIRYGSFKRIHDSLELFRRMEKASILELAIWKMAIGSTCQTSTDSRSMEREDDRIVCGADVIIPQVSGYLGGTTDWRMNPLIAGQAP
ncbi:MAG: hypothetical protein SGBAC_012771 [Bacillariaceae sp.]